MFEMQQYGEFARTVSHDIEQLCNQIAKDGVLVFVKLLRTNLSRVSSVKNCSSFGNLDLAIWVSTPSFGTLVPSSPRIGRSILFNITTVENI